MRSFGERFDHVNGILRIRYLMEARLGSFESTKGFYSLIPAFQPAAAFSTACTTRVRRHETSKGRKLSLLAWMAHLI